MAWLTAVPAGGAHDHLAAVLLAQRSDASTAYWSGSFISNPASCCADPGSRLVQTRMAFPRRHLFDADRVFIGYEAQLAFEEQDGVRPAETRTSSTWHA